MSACGTRPAIADTRVRWSQAVLWGTPGVGPPVRDHPDAANSALPDEYADDCRSTSSY